MRFSIRDLLWATLMVAMGLGWWASYRALDASRQAIEVKHLAAVQQATRLRLTLVEAKEMHDGLRFFIRTRIQGSQSWDEVDWSVLDEPLVQP